MPPIETPNDSAVDAPAPTSATASCPNCGETLVEGARFCEACGQELGEHPQPRIVTSIGPSATCSSCGATAFSDQPDGGSYCENCGVRRPAGLAHAEADLEVIAVASDIGKRHHNNEDAFGIAVLPRAYIGVVCDGVSSSARPDTASHPAADAAARTFLRILDAAPEGEPDAAIAEAATVAAAGAAQGAAAGPRGPATEPAAPGDAPAPGDQASVDQGATPSGRRAAGKNPPSTTFVSAVVTRDAVTVGWVGDSRAYWIADDGESACLTIDDTLGGQLAAAGVQVSDDAPNAAALIRWLGADAIDASPHVATFQPSGPGRVIVCSDGLYRYAPEAAELAAATPAGTPFDVVRTLVQFALDAGGGDNVTVAVLPFPPREG